MPRIIRFPEGDWPEAAVIWAALIGAPSSGKTPPLRLMSEASQRLEHDDEPKWHATLTWLLARSHMAPIAKLNERSGDVRLSFQPNRIC
jgi:hypothetical protein